MNRSVVLAVMAILVVGFALPAAAQEVTFAYGFTEGTKLRYRVKLNQELDFGGNAMGQIADLQVTVTCKSAAEGKYGMEMTFDKADMSRQMFGNLSSDPIAEAMIGKSVSYQVDSAGEVSDIKPVGYYEEWERMEQFVTMVVENWYVHLPGKAFAPGGTWDHAQKDKGDGGMDVATTTLYKFKESKKEGGRNCAVVTGDIATDLSGQSATGMGTFDVKGGGKGKIEFSYDPEARLVVKLKARMDVKTEMSPTSGGGNATSVNVTYQLERALL